MIIVKMIGERETGLTFEVYKYLWHFFPLIQPRAIKT